jgi:hypothetical protein
LDIRRLDVFTGRPHEDKIFSGAISPPAALESLPFYLDALQPEENDYFYGAAEEGVRRTSSLWDAALSFFRKFNEIVQ